MEFYETKIGTFMGIPIHHHTAEFDFSDYDNFLLKFRGKKPSGYSYYKNGNIPAGIILLWKKQDGTIAEERICFLTFQTMICRSWDFGSKSEKLGDYRSLDFKYSTLRLQVDVDSYIDYFRVYRIDNIKSKIFKKGEDL